MKKFKPITSSVQALFEHYQILQKDSLRSKLLSEQKYAMFEIYRGNTEAVRTLFEETDISKKTKDIMLMPFFRNSSSNLESSAYHMLQAERIDVEVHKIWNELEELLYKNE